MAVVKTLALLCLLALSTGVLGRCFALLGFSPTCELPRISVAPGTKTVYAQPGLSLVLRLAGVTLFGPMHVPWGCCLRFGVPHLWQTAMPCILVWPLAALSSAFHGLELLSSHLPV